jgi:hypothetical protein
MKLTFIPGPNKNVRAYDVQTIETDKTMAADFNSSSWDVGNYRTGILVAVWENIDATNSTMILEGSDDGTNWGELGGNLGGKVIDDTDDATQIWEFTIFTMKYVRLAYKANNVTAGTVTITGMGKS